MAHLAFDRVTMTYDGTTRVLDALDLDVASGEAHALLGPSGSGKTTLLSLLSGLLQPDAGRVLFDGVDVTKQSPRSRNIAQVFQFPVLYPAMNVRDNLAFPLRNRDVPHAQAQSRVAVIAELLELVPLLDRLPRSLSAYDKQKVALGRALVRMDVAAVLLDEPLTAVEPAAKWRLRKALKEVQRELGLTMIYVTHDQLEALTFADRVSLIDKGRLLQTGTPEALVDDPAHTFVGHFIGSPGMNVLPATLASALCIGTPGDDCEVGFRPGDARVSSARSERSIAVRTTLAEVLGTRDGIPWGVLTAMLGGGLGGAVVRTRQPIDLSVPGQGWLAVPPDKIRLFRNGWRADA